MTAPINSREGIPPSGITRVVLNQAKMKKKELASVIPALSDRNILAEKSGYIFNSSIVGDSLFLGILPYFISGQRTYHYEIELPDRGKCVLFGFITPNGTIALLFKPEEDTYNGELLPGMADIFCDNYVRLARFLVENGFSCAFELDFVTKNVLEEIKLFAELPATIRELSLQPTPFDRME
ncbi:MAG: hypothetical protein KAI66_02010 [Lentisphaeria bacterium]|nr:hypothetical protein [Lentisphaeria bacterium]